jgi:hypothetical protein
MVGFKKRIQKNKEGVLEQFQAWYHERTLGVKNGINFVVGWIFLKTLFIEALSTKRMNSYNSLKIKIGFPTSSEVL